MNIGEKGNFWQDSLHSSYLKEIFLSVSIISNDISFHRSIIMPSDAKKKREQKKKEAAKAKQVNKKTEEKEEVNTDVLLYPGHSKIFT